MTRQKVITAATYVILTTAVAVVLVLPPALSIPDASAAPAPASKVRLRGVLRDFRGAHPDFDVAPDQGYGHYAGNVARTLGAHGRPAFSPNSERVTDFVLDRQLVVPNTDFAVQATVLGAAIYSGSYHRPVTVQLAVGGTTFEPFGPFARPVEGSVNDDQSATDWVNPGANPRIETLAPKFTAGTPVVVTGKSWNRRAGRSGFANDDWDTKKVASTSDDSVQIKVLVDGDDVPDLGGEFDQASVADFVRDYIDYDSGTMDLGPHQAIFLFELAANGATGGDFQDLVLLVSLATDAALFQDGEIGGTETGRTDGGYRVDASWTDAAGNAIAPHLFDRAGPVLAPPFDVLLAVGDAGSLSTQDAAKKAAMEAWGHRVTVIDDEAPQSAYDAAVAVHDVAYVSEEVEHSRLGSKLTNARIGVVNEDKDLSDAEFGFSAGFATYTDTRITITDNTHPITEGFPLGPLAITDANWNLSRADGGLAPGARRLADKYGQAQPTLMVIERGGSRHAAGPAPARRVRLPWGNHATDFTTINANGLTIMQRSVDWAARNPAPFDSCGDAVTDAPGSAGPASNGGIASTASFDEWFRDARGANLSAAHALALVQDGDGVWRYETDGFHPADDRLLGNENATHNAHFTFAFAADFLYTACGEQFFQFEGGDGVWVFVDDRLVIDLGGVGAPDAQRVDLDRLGLADGTTHRLRFFYAQRDAANAVFRMRTNIDLDPGTGPVTISGNFD